MRPVLMLALLALTLLALTVAPLPATADAGHDEARAQHLFTEVRCVACQGQDIGDSDAAIAADMRREIRAEIAAGRSDAEIRAGLNAHYGDYVLFRPRLTASNLILWGLPPLIVVAGLIVFGLVSKRRGESRSYDLSEDERKKLHDLMKSR